MRATARLDRGVNRVMVRAWPPLAAPARGGSPRPRSDLGALGRPPAAPGRGAPPARLLLARTAAAAGPAAWRSGAATRGQRRAHARTGDLRGDRRLRRVCLIASQFVDYRGGRGRAARATRGCRRRSPPLDRRRSRRRPPTPTCWSRSALLAVALALVAAATGRNRLGRIVFVLGLLGLAVVLLVDRPAGLDAGSQAARFSGATAVLAGAASTPSWPPRRG